MIMYLIYVAVIVILIALVGYRILVFIVRHCKNQELYVKYPEAQPFFRQNSLSDAVLLIHGFSSTPREMKHIADALYEAGYTVRGMLLPGHATRPAELENTTSKDWYAAVVKEFIDLQKKYPKVYVVGFSLGGLLSLRLAAEYDSAGLVAIAPFLKLSAYHFPVKNPDLLVKAFLPLMPYVFKTRFYTNINNPIEQKQHLCYTAIPTRPLRSMLDLADTVFSLLPMIHHPTLLIHTEQDKVVCKTGTQHIYETIPAHQKKLLWVEKSNHIIPVDYDRHEVCAAIVTFFNTIRGCTTDRTIRS